MLKKYLKKLTEIANRGDAREESYYSSLAALILTNFFEFRLYREGRLIDSVQIARPYVINKLGTIPPVEKESEFIKLLFEPVAISCSVLSIST